MRSLQKLLAAVALLAALPLSAEDWPQFRGPGGEGHSSEKGLPLQWSESQNILWKTPVAGRGWSSPVVAGGRVWLTTSVERRGTASLRLLAYDVASGKEVLNVEVFSVADALLKNAKNSLASPTPIVEGDRVYVHFGADGTAAVTTDGKIVWKVQLRYDSMHGNGGSPTLYRDLLILSCDGADDAYVIALDKNTGKTRWKTKRRQPYDQAYTTPLVIQVDGRDQVISIGAYRAAAYDPTTGREIWRVRYGDGFSNVPRPVYSHGLVFIGTGFQEPSMLAVRPTGTGDVTDTHVAYSIERGAPFTPSPLIVGDEFYMVSDIGVASCLDVKTGKIHWQQRVSGNYSASPLFADNRIYFLSEEGVATVIAPGKEFRRLAVNTLDGTTFASIAVSQGTLFVRSDTHLYRIGTK
ncbi:MAG TPA: PQQ-binding-like beta-propeller repeat protein [Terriglobia bacterium]|nr:PQQ-binding-like beta-propeller repeat protein [Terriglobia bacterium]